MLTGQSQATAQTTRNLFPLPAAPHNLPLFKALKQSEIQAVLLGNAVGRVAFPLNGRVELLSINYVYVNGWIYGRTAAATFLPRNAAVTFEVEDRSAAGEWRRVVVHGCLDLVESDGEGETSGILGKALSRIRQLVEPATGDRPSPLLRDQLFCVRVMEISGRGSLPATPSLRSAS